MLLGEVLTKENTPNLTVRLQALGLLLDCRLKRGAWSSFLSTLMPQNLTGFQTGHAKDGLAQMKHGIHEKIRQKWQLFPGLPSARSQTQIPPGGWGARRWVLERVRESPQRTAIFGTLTPLWGSCGSDSQSLACEFPLPRHLHYQEQPGIPAFPKNLPKWHIFQFNKYCATSSKCL